MSLPIPRERFITSRDGVRLRTLTWTPEGEARANLCFLHGWGEHADRYALPTAHFLPLGFACHAVDVRGHGASAGLRGFIERYDEYLDDVDAWLREILDAADETPTFLIGHSQGGLISTRFVEERDLAKRLAGLALSSPFFALKMKVPWVKRFAADRLSRVWPSLAIPADLDVNALTHDRSIVDGYANDPLVLTKACVRWLTETLVAQRLAVERASKVRLPVLVMHGAADRIADPDVSRDFFERCSSDDKSLEIYEGLFHEIFNELDRASVYADLQAWLEARLSG